METDWREWEGSHATLLARGSSFVRFRCGDRSRCRGSGARQRQRHGTGVSVTEADCRAQIGGLWVTAENRGFCVRFWLSTAGGNKDEALVAFHGDIGGRIDGKLQLLEQARSISDESLQNAAGYGSRLYRGPYVRIARPGTYGSSGHHLKDRRTLLEIRIAMAALDALKQHYGFKRFHLVGHSGGGHTVAGLVQVRSDIRS